MKFNHLNVPTHWRNYWTRYPEGHTILEALISWVSQVDSMVDNQNKLNDNVAQFRNEIDEFVKRFDERLQDEVTQTLNDWQNSGFLDVVISEALQWELDDFKATTEQNFLTVNQQMQETDLDLEGRGINPMAYGAVGDGLADDTAIFTTIASKGLDIYIPRGKTFRLTNSLIVDSIKLYGGGKIVKGKSDLQNFIIMKGQNPIVEGIEFTADDTAGNGRNIIYVDEATENARIANNIFNDIGNTYCAITASDPAEGTLYQTNIKGLTIENNRFNGFSRQLYLSSIDNLTVTENMFENSRYDAIRTRRNMNGIIITENHFLNIGERTDDQTRDCIDAFWSGRNMIISNNYMENCSMLGVDIKGIAFDDDPSLYGVNSRCIISNNVMKRMVAGAIKVNGDLYGDIKSHGQIVITGNLISEVGLTVKGLAAITLSSTSTATVSDNHIFSNFGVGLHITGPHYGYSIVKGNTFQNNGHFDIRFDNGKGCLISNNIFAEFTELLHHYGKTQVSKILVGDYGGGRILSIQNNIFDGDEKVITGAGQKLLKYVNVFTDNMILGDCYVERDGMTISQGRVLFTDFGSLPTKEGFNLDNYNLGDVLINRRAVPAGEAMKIVGVSSTFNTLTGSANVTVSSNVIRLSGDFDFNSVNVGSVITFSGGVLGIYHITQINEDEFTIHLDREIERSATAVNVNLRTKEFLSVNAQ